MLPLSLDPAPPPRAARRRPVPRWWQPTLKTAVHLLCLVPFVVLVGRGAAGDLGANPVEAVVRDLGDWALRFLVIALAVTPLRKILAWQAVARYRRMLGLWAFAYACLHVASYVVLDQFFDWHNILLEIVKHKFITAGMAALLLLIPLAVTSTNGMVRRLGGQRWRRLHRAVYVVGPLAAIHYLWMVKADIHQPLIYGALIAMLLGYRMIKLLRERMLIEPAP
jgi:sulfoxide reductase heme-binding subunit YedZ